MAGVLARAEHRGLGPFSSATGASLSPYCGVLAVAEPRGPKAVVLGDMRSIAPIMPSFPGRAQPRDPCWLLRARWFMTGLDCLRPSERDESDRAGFLTGAGRVRRVERRQSCRVRSGRGPTRAGAASVPWARAASLGAREADSLVGAVDGSASAGSGRPIRGKAETLKF